MARAGFQNSLLVSIDNLRTRATPRAPLAFGSAIRARNRLLTFEGELGIIFEWEDQNDQLQAVGFITC
jgi:hypothetical protein